ncbi:hypothetical protein YC2023_107860 [Brassica napus]
MGSTLESGPSTSIKRTPRSPLLEGDLRTNLHSCYQGTNDVYQSIPRWRDRKTKVLAFFNYQGGRTHYEDMSPSPYYSVELSTDRLNYQLVPTCSCWSAPKPQVRTLQSLVRTGSGSHPQTDPHSPWFLLVLGLNFKSDLYGPRSLLVPGPNLKADLYNLWARHEQSSPSSILVGTQLATI